MKHILIVVESSPFSLERDEAHDETNKYHLPCITFGAPAVTTIGGEKLNLIHGYWMRLLLHPNKLFIRVAATYGFDF